MEYCTCLIIRVLARAGLSLTLMAWIIGQWESATISERFVSGQITMGFNNSSVTFGWKPALQCVDSVHFMIVGISAPVMNFPGAAIWSTGSQHVVVRIDHWLLCLTFLIAAVLETAILAFAGAIRDGGNADRRTSAAPDFRNAEGWPVSTQRSNVTV